jgi:hypothetical protein
VLAKSFPNYQESQNGGGAEHKKLSAHPAHQCIRCYCVRSRAKGQASGSLGQATARGRHSPVGKSRQPWHNGES